MNESISKYINETHQFNILSLNEEIELAEKIKNGSLSARNHMINAHLRIVYNIARHFVNKNSEMLEDLIQEGNLGLVYAADNFDSSKNLRFVVYAKMWVKEFIRRRFYKSLYILSTPFRIIQKSFQIRNNEETVLEKEKKTGENIAIYNIAKDAVSTNDEAFMNNFNNFYTDYCSSHEKSYEHHSIMQHIYHLSNSILTDKEKVVFKRRFSNTCKSVSYQKISQELQISTETVRNIEKKVLQKLKRNL